MFDAHLHLQDPRFDLCRERVIADAVSAGVQACCCCGCEPTDWPAVAALAAPAEAFRVQCSVSGEHCPAFAILPAFGVHPWYAGNLPADWLERLERLLLAHPLAPVGEIGLDGIRAHPPREIQAQVLTAQLALACRLQRPVVLHGARAWGALLEALRPFAPRLRGAVLHAFGGSADVLREALALGCRVSFAGPVCDPAATRVRAAAAATPADRLLIETDAPDMLPIGGEPAEAGALNQPSNLPRIAAAMAKLRGVASDRIDALTDANARRIYGLDARRALRQ